jgi:hypothetical protein
LEDAPVVLRIGPGAGDLVLDLGGAFQAEVGRALARQIVQPVEDVGRQDRAFDADAGVDHAYRGARMTGDGWLGSRNTQSSTDMDVVGGRCQTLSFRPTKASIKSVATWAVLARVSANHEALCKVDRAAGDRVVDGAQEVLRGQGHGCASAEAPPSRTRRSLERTPRGWITANIERGTKRRLDQEHDFLMLASEVDHGGHAFAKALRWWTRRSAHRGWQPRRSSWPDRKTPDPPP